MKTMTTDLKKAQEKMIHSFLKREKELGIIQDTEEYDALFNTYINQISSGKPAVKVRPQSGQILSEPINDTFKEIYIDFLTLFNQVNEIDNLSSRHEQISQSSFRQLFNRVKAVRDTLTRYEDILRYRGVNEMLLESFYVFEDTQTTDTYTDRYGEGIAKGYRVHYKQENDCIELPLVTQTNQLVQDNGLRLAQVKIGKQFGSGFTRLANPETNVEKLIDTSKETYWSETILTNEPLEIEEGELSDIEKGTHWYYVRQGALCELIIDYDYPTLINEIELIPFSEFPLEVVAIKYYESVMGEEKEHYIVHNHAKERLLPKLSRENIRYQFPDILTQRLVIVLNQSHYIKTEYHIPEKAKAEIMSWFSDKSNWKLDKENVFNPIYLNKLEEEPAFMNFVKATSGTNNSIERALGYGEDGKPSIVNKYEYQYGLYQLNTFHNEYKEMGVYVSPWITSETEVSRIRLDVDVELPKIEVEQKEIPITDVEYYISYHNSPEHADDWFPIVPMNQKLIEAEKLDVSNVSGRFVARPRFKVNEILEIRKNGIKIDNLMFVFKNGEIELAEWDRYAQYTITYKPHDDSYLIDFEKMLDEAKWAGNQDKLIRTHRMEVRGTDDKGTIQIPHHPYVDLTTVYAEMDADSNWSPSFLGQDYVPMRVYMINEEGYRIQQPQYREDLNNEVETWLMNKTNYADQEAQNLEPFDSSILNYQYSLNGDKIQFNTRIPSSTKIFIEYPYYVSGFYLKAILRRNHPAYVGMTPVLHEYRLYLEG